MKTCSQHPQKIARRKCFECKKPICPQCQFKAHHHIFCGSACISAFKGEETVVENELQNIAKKLDTSIHEDLQEYRQDIVSEVDAKIQKSQEEIEFKLSELKSHLDTQETHFKGFISELRHSFQSKFSEKNRKDEQHSDQYVEALKDLRQLLLSSRSTVLESNQRLGHFKRLFFKGRRVWLKFAKNLIPTLYKKWDVHEGRINETLLKNHQNLVEQINSELSQFKALQSESQKEAKASLELVKSELESKYDHSSSKVLQLNEDTQKNVSSRLELLESNIEKTSETNQGFQNEQFEKLQNSLRDSIAQLNDEYDQLKSDLAAHSDKDRDFQDQKLTNIQSSFDDSINKIMFQSQELRSAFNEDYQAMTQDVSGLFEKHLDQIDTQISFLKQKVEGQVANNLETTNQLRQEYLDLQVKSEETIDQKLLDLRQNFKRELIEKLQSLLDDMASLITSQKGNWREVIASAKEGAFEAGQNLSGGLDQELRKEMRSLAQVQSTAFHKFVEELREKIQNKLFKQISPWYRRLIFASALMLMFLCFAIPSFLLFKSSQLLTQQKNEILEKQLLFEEEVQNLMSSLHGRIEQFKKSQLRKTQNVLTPRKKASLVSLDRGSIDKKEFSFTFDGGSNARAAKEILEILRKNKIQTTVFLTGMFVQNYPDIVMTIVEDGHEVGNHMLKHDHLVDQKFKTIYTKDQLYREFDEVEIAFLDITGKRLAPIWRAPYGEVNREILEWANEYGYTHIGWTRSKKKSLDTLDWVADKRHKWYRSPQQIQDHILSFEQTAFNGMNGGVVLMHLGSERPSDKRAHLSLDRTLIELKERGYKNVKVSKWLQ